MNQITKDLVLNYCQKYGYKLIYQKNINDGIRYKFAGKDTAGKKDLLADLGKLLRRYDYELKDWQVSEKYNMAEFEKTIYFTVSLKGENK